MSLAMYPDEVNLIDEVFKYLNQALAEPPIPPKTPLSPTHLEAIIQILDRWPLSQRFPGELIFRYCYGPNYLLWLISTYFQLLTWPAF